MATEITKQKAGYEDIQFGLTTEIQNRQEGTTIVPKEITQINASHIPYDEFQSVEQAISAVGGGTSSSTTIIYGSGVPSVTINPLNGTNAMYVDTVTNTSYICKDATEDANVWVVNGSGQFADVGTSIGKAVQFMAQVTAENEQIVIPEGTNAFAIDSITIADGGSITIPDDSVFKVI